MDSVEKSVAVPGAGAQRRRAFSYVHVVSFEETNLVGNVYFARHIAWQGRCREMFLREHAPQILTELATDLRLVTLKTNCEYFEEIKAFDMIEVLMWLAHIRQNRIGLDFEYRRISADNSVIVASGFQQLSCMKLANGVMIPIAPPAMLTRALHVL
jgi:enediyne biosynthesis thioesterase